MRFTTRSSPVTHKTDGVDLQQQCSRAALRGCFRIEDVSFAKDLFEGMNAGWAFVQQVAQVRRRISSVGNGQEHVCSLLYRKPDRNDISGLRSAAQPAPHVTEREGFGEIPTEISK